MSMYNIIRSSYTTMDRCTPFLCVVLLLLGCSCFGEPSPDGPRMGVVAGDEIKTPRLRKLTSTNPELGRARISPYSGASSDPVSIRLDMEGVVYEVDPGFLSVTIDAGQIHQNWQSINFTSPRVINMAKALNPAMLRVGGTSADFLLFKETASYASNDVNFTMTTAQWDAVNEFVQVVGWEFIFGLNSLLRNPYPVGVWDSTNAAQLMAYSSSKGYTVNWELGNEPDLWDHHEYNISAPEHAKDFSVLKQLVEKEMQFGKVMIVGPDVAGSELYYASFLLNVEKGILNATTYHHYYGNGQTAKLSEFYDVKLLDSFIRIAIDFRGISEVWAPNTSLWIGETSSMYDGGAPHLSDTYVAGFMWLDKLAIAALVGHERVFRQDFVGGSYSLLDSNQYPLPDFWLSVLHKKLVGTKVLYVVGSLEENRYLRAYAHCAKSPYPAGSVVMLLLNMNFSSVSADLVNSELSSSSRDVYWLTPPTGNLTSKSVQLNGQLVQLVDSTELPDLKPTEQPASTTITLPPISFGFYVFKDTKAPACM